MKRLVLSFTSNPSPQLVETTFEHPVLGKDRQLRAVRGDDVGASSDAAGSFKWTSAVKALAVLLLRSAAWGRRCPDEREDKIPVVEGWHGSPAASLNYAISKSTSWLGGMFGTDANDRSNIVFLINRSNPDFKTLPGEPVVLCVDVDALPPEAIQIVLDRAPVESADELENMASEIELQCGKPMGHSASAGADSVTFDSNQSAAKKGQPSDREESRPPLPRDDWASTAETEIHFADSIAYHSAAFAGRVGELTTINDRLSSSDGAYVFVEGPSGFGKTALLAQLTERYPHAAYHFFNQSLSGTTVLFDPNRETCFLRNLCGQILRKSASKKRIPEADPRAAYLVLLAEPLPPETCRIVIIDAVDEIDPTRNFLKGLFPHDLGARTFVVFSARTIGDRSFVRHVGLTASDIALTITLDRFDSGGVAALLRKAGGDAVEWSANERFVGALLATTDGDPFYLRFLAEDIRAGRIGPENIGETPKGLYDYLDSQFEILSRCAQRQQQRDVLGYILTAKGPISRATLISCVEGLDHLNFEATIQGIRRFLLEHRGEFTFCHERFRQYFLDKAGLSS